MTKSFLIVFAACTSAVAASNSSGSNIWLSAHNVYRCVHGVPNLQWSDAVAYEAQKWADRGVYEHSHGSSASYELAPPAGPAGENIAAGHGSVSAVVDAWYNEVSDCAGYWPGCEHPTAMVGHFTAMIWNGVKELGCGQGTANGRAFYVCHYKGDDTKNCNTPNMGGCYASNVPPPLSSTSQCGGGASPVPSPPPTPSSSCGNTGADCVGWVGAGFCSQSNEYYNYMKDNCNKACGFCAPAPVPSPPPTPSSICGNVGKDADCYRWASAGFCPPSRYANYMKANCEKACGFC